MLCGMGNLTSKKKMLYKAFLKNDANEIRRVFRNYDFEKEDISREERILYRKAVEIAAYYGLVDILKVLLEEDFVEKYGSVENRALHYGVWKGNMRAVELLVSAGYSCQSRNHFHETALYVAVCRNNSSLVDYLIRQGVDMNERTRGWTPLQVAAGRNHTDVLRVLIRHGAGLNIEDDKGTTALLLAIFQRHVTNVLYLIYGGCHVNWNRIKHIDYVQKACENRKPIERLLKAEIMEVKSLAECSRRAIRQHLGQRLVSKVQKLPLPASLKDFVLLKKELSITDLDDEFYKFTSKPE